MFSFKESEVQKLEPVLSPKSMPVCCLFYIGFQRWKKKSEVNFEAHYVSDSFIDEGTKSDVHYSKPK